MDPTFLTDFKIIFIDSSVNKNHENIKINGNLISVLDETELKMIRF